MQDLQNVLVLVGGLVVFFIIIHGLWQSKKEKNSKFAQVREKEKTAAINKKRPSQTEFGNGEAVSAAKTVKPNTPKVRKEPGFSAISIDDDVMDDDDPLFQAPSAATHRKPSTPVSAPAASPEPQPEVATVPEVDADVQVQKVQPEQTQEALLQEAVEAELAAKASEEPAVDASEQFVEPVIEAMPEPEPVAPVIEKPVLQEVEKPQPENIVLNVVHCQDDFFGGAELFDCLERHGLHYNRGYYLRHMDSSGSGDVIFVVGNTLQPGIFDRDNPSDFATKGIYLLMQLPSVGDARQNFKIMLSTAQQIADDLGALLQDEKRNMMTPNRLDAYFEQIKVYTKRQKAYQEYLVELEKQEQDQA